MFKLVIFDLDGTLVNSIFDLGDSVNTVLKAQGLRTYGYEDFKHFVGNGTRKLIERALPEDMRTDENIDRFHAQFSLEYRKHCLDKTRPYDGITELVEKLRQAGIRTAVASNKPDEFSRYIVEKTFGRESFDIVMGKREGKPTKPDPAIIYDILSALDIPPSQAVVAGDSDVDVFTAHNADLACIGCEWGFRGREELEKAGADFIIGSPEEMSGLII